MGDHFGSASTRDNSALSPLMDPTATAKVNKAAVLGVGGEGVNLDRDGRGMKAEKLQERV